MRAHSSSPVSFCLSRLYDCPSYNFSTSAHPPILIIVGIAYTLSPYSTTPSFVARSYFQFETGGMFLTYRNLHVTLNLTLTRALKVDKVLVDAGRAVGVEATVTQPAEGAGVSGGKVRCGAKNLYSRRLIAPSAAHVYHLSVVVYDVIDKWMKLVRVLLFLPVTSRKR